MSSGSHGSLEQLLNKIENLANKNNKISFGLLLNAIGRRSFGPILFFFGMILAAPGLADIPGVPVVIGFILLLIILQVLMWREHIWLPSWIKNWSISSKQLIKSVNYLRKPALYLDKLFKQRLTFLVNTASTWMICLICLLIVLATPVMELIPFSANLAGLIFMTFGISLISNDGFFALLAICLLFLLLGVVIGFTF
ncbi:exopolysaccharide biosynthesis protein [Legionella israelensis]|uniref:Exopolysaccharide biosynthesis protein n=1 Tax=Legionella israelensis TaxID=454 RepID=A0AAX1EDA9_9GAMM|nr:exopolysaccharide biosynthesis protein [Legionella israelensis]QBR83090.1 exopolysaccharide biosynthesis protein [Legionella israelensis]